MTVAQGPTTGRPLLAASSILAALLTFATVAACVPSSSVSSSPTDGSPAPVTQSPSPASVACQPAVDPEVPAYAVDSCDEAVAAARSMTEDQALPVSRIYLTSGVFDCEDFWPGVGSPDNCPAASVIPGVAMHGWISFAGDERIMAVALYRASPSGAEQAVAALWTSEVKAFAVPPAGWRMP